MKADRERHGIRGWVVLLFSVFGLLIPVLCSRAQCAFTSGSTGTDGAFTPTNSMPSTGWSISNNVVTVTNKPDGVFNFTSIYIEANWVVKFTKNILNTPVYLLAQSNVTINGTIDVSGTRPDGVTSSGGLAGPGGFDGGGSGSPGGSPGFGPGGGAPNNSTYANAGYGTPGYWGTDGTNGIAYGVLDIFPMIGGSGGGGGATPGYSAGAGGGAILIASSGTLSCQGTVTSTGPQGQGYGASASGGAIRLVANTVQGEGIIDATGASAPGRIRIEACNNQRSTLTSPMATYGPPGVVFLNPNPTIQVSSIAGTSTPWPPAGSLTVPDVYLPTNFVNPATISVAASNVPLGGTFKVIITPA